METKEQLVEKLYPYMDDNKSGARYEEYSGNDIIAIKRLHFIEGYKTAQEWTPVEDALPPVNDACEFDKKYGFSKEVLLKTRDGVYAVGVYAHNSACFSVKGSSLLYKITHWRYI